MREQNPTTDILMSKTSVQVKVVGIDDQEKSEVAMKSKSMILRSIQAAIVLSEGRRVERGRANVMERTTPNTLRTNHLNATATGGQEALAAETRHPEIKFWIWTTRTASRCWQYDVDGPVLQYCTIV